MAPPFRPLHIPPLLVATSFAIGGLMPFWDAPGALRAFGLPERFVQFEGSRTFFIISGTRISTIGLALWTFYLQGKFDAMDTILTLTGFYIGAIDGYITWQEGIPGTTIFRAGSGLLVGLWGLFRMCTRA